MLRFVSVAVGAAAIVFSSLNTTGAAAQSAASQPIGQPLQLLKIVEQPAKPSEVHPAKRAQNHAKHATRIVGQKKTHTHLAAIRRHRPPIVRTQAAALPTPAPDSAWPAPNTATPTSVNTVAPESTSASAGQTEAPAQRADMSAPKMETSAPAEVTVGGQTVKVDSPQVANEIDLAAEDTKPAPSDAASTTNATSQSHETAEAMQKSDPAKASVFTLPPTNEVGSTSWILQVLAALGGAVTAGAVAWFLIGGTPQRTYG